MSSVTADTCENSLWTISLSANQAPTTPTIEAVSILGRQPWHGYTWQCQTWLGDEEENRRMTVSSRYTTLPPVQKLVKETEAKRQGENNHFSGAVVQSK